MNYPNLITFAFYWIAAGSVLWSVFVATGMFHLNGRLLPIATATLAMIVCWPLFAGAWLLGVRRMRG